MRHVRFTLLVLLAWLALPAPAAAQCAPEDTVDSFLALKAEIEGRTTSASDGDVICIDPGTYSNEGVEIVVPNRPGAADFVTVTTTGGCADSRPASESTTGLAYLQSTGSNQEVFVTADEANWWKFECLAFGMTPTATQGSFAILSVGGVSQSNTALRAYKIHFDRVVFPSFIDGEVTQAIRIAMVEDFSITRSYCGNILGPGDDDIGVSETQCFSMNNAYCAPCVFDDLFVGAAAEGILAGGGDPAADDHNPVNITITDSTFYRDPATYADPPGDDESVGVHKHFIEFKYGIGGYIARNTFTNNPSFAEDHGTAPAILFSPRNQGGECTGCRVGEFLVENNLMINVGQMVQVIGEDDIFTTAETYDIEIRNNVAEVLYGCWQFGLSPDQTVITNNTCVYIGSLPNAVIPINNLVMPIGDSLDVNNNIFFTGDYGINTDDGPNGEDGLDMFFTDWTFSGNIIFGLELATQTVLEDWPAGNTFVTKAAMEGEFINFGAKNYCVSPSSAYYGKGADCSQIPALAGEGSSGSSGKIRIRFRLTE